VCDDSFMKLDSLYSFGWLFIDYLVYIAVHFSSYIAVHFSSYSKETSSSFSLSIISYTLHQTYKGKSVERPLFLHTAIVTKHWKWEGVKMRHST